MAEGTESGSVWDFAVSLEEARTAPIPEGARSAQLMNRGSMTVRFYAPDKIDRQTPHEQDEIYVVASGAGWFVNGDRRAKFETGHVLFVAAGIEHRFEDFTDDFATWVVFYGTQGGEDAS